MTIPPRSPPATADAGRWVLTMRSELTGRRLNAGRRHLRTVLHEYAAHHNQHRPRRDRSLRPPHGSADDGRDLAAAKVQRRRVPGGQISEYQQGA
jgi:putative transposase